MSLRTLVTADAASIGGTKCFPQLLEVASECSKFQLEPLGSVRCRIEQTEIAGREGSEKLCKRVHLIVIILFPCLLRFGTRYIGQHQEEIQD